MGGGKSKPCLPEPWRPMPMSAQENVIYLKSYEPQNSELKHLRILLHGPVGAGKSSFVNSVESALRGQVAVRAPVDAKSGHSFTLKYKTYKIHKDRQSSYAFVFNDIMGFEQNLSKGVQVEDVRLALRGHVREGYEFLPDRPLTESNLGYNPNPSLADKVHVLVCVFPADVVSLLTKEKLQKLKEVRQTATDLGIPQLAILTKSDEACPAVKTNVYNIYKSKYLKQQVEKFSMLLGIPLNCIFLVKNYESEIVTHDSINGPILTAVKQMVMYGEDCVNYIES